MASLPSNSTSHPSCLLAQHQQPQYPKANNFVFYSREKGELPIFPNSHPYIYLWTTSMGISFPQKEEAIPGKSCVLRLFRVSTGKPIFSISPLSTSTSLLLTCPFSCHLCIDACSSPSLLKKNYLTFPFRQDPKFILPFTVKLSHEWGQSLPEAVSSSPIHFSNPTILLSPHCYLKTLLLKSFKMKPIGKAFCEPYFTSSLCYTWHCWLLPPSWNSQIPWLLWHIFFLSLMQWRFKNKYDKAPDFKQRL